MSKYLLTNEIYKMLEGGTCPVCGEYFKPNGTGAEGDKLTHWLLKQMPWDEILNEEAVPVHDWRCHLGKCKNNISFYDTTKEFKQNIENAMYRWINRKWWRKYVFKKALNQIDEIYAYAVSKTNSGRNAYDYNGCSLD